MRWLYRGELRIHIISRMMRVVVTDGMISRIADMRHGYMVEDELEWRPLL